LLLLIGAAALVAVIVRSTGPKETLAGQVRRMLADGKFAAETALTEGELTVLQVYLPRDRAPAAIQAVRRSLPEGVRIIPGTGTPQPESPAHGLLALERDGEKVILYFLPPLEQTPAPKRTPKPRSTAQRERPVVAICIDDMGQSSDALEWFERNPYPLNAAVLPFLPLSEETARRLHAAEVEVLCHLPMQPEDPGAHPPGPGAILFGTGEPDLKAAVARALDAIPSVRGFNNHMGSAMTADRLYMRWVLEAARGKASYFLDSRTTAQTVAEAVGAEMGFPVLRRHVFLDDVAEAAYIRRQLRLALARAREQAPIVAIGHPHPVTLRTLGEELPGLAKQARLVRFSELIK